MSLYVVDSRTGFINYVNVRSPLLVSSTRLALRAYDCVNAPHPLEDDRIWELFVNQLREDELIALLFVSRRLYTFLRFHRIWLTVASAKSLPSSVLSQPPPLGARAVHEQINAVKVRKQCEDTWMRILDFAGRSSQLFEPGASASDLRELESVLGRALPLTLHVSLSCHDGQTDGLRARGILSSHRLLRCSEIPSETAILVAKLGPALSSTASAVATATIPRIPSSDKDGTLNVDAAIAVSASAVLGESPQLAVDGISGAVFEVFGMTVVWQAPSWLAWLQGTLM
jgi:hypothetical protein